MSKLDPATQNGRRSAMAATLLATGGVALLGGQASAQAGAPDGFRAVDDYANVNSYTINDDGSIRLVMNDGQIVTVAAADAQVIEGVLYLNAEAITIGAPVATGAAAGGGGGGAILGVLGGLGLAGAAAGGGGGGGGSGGGPTTPPAPNNAPSFTSGSTASLDENTTATGYTATATDADGDTLTYSISGGADGGLFSINSSTGVLSFSGAPDFESPGDGNTDNVYEVTIQVTDGRGGSATQTVQVTVNNVEEAPEFSSAATVSVAENQTAAIDVDATDPDGTGTITYTLSGADAALFNIDANTGEVTFIAAPDFESPADANGDNDYEITVTADDGSAQSSQNITVTVTNQNDNNPSITSAAAFNVDENQTAAFTGTATDADGDTISYSLTGADAALFNIDSATGVVTFITAPDREAPGDANGDNIYEVNLVVSDGVNTDVQAVSITVDNVNEAPAITSSASASVAENQTTAIDVNATDPEGQALTYTLSGADAALFNIDANTGEVTFIAAPDFESPADANGDNDYEITVTASDGSAQSSQNITVTVTNQNDNNPSITSAAAFNVDENQTAAFTGTATDADGDTISYSLTGADAALFNIDSATGVVTFITAPDFEAPADADGDNDYQINLVASDGVNSDVQAVTITVDDVSDVPPVITSAGSANAAENQTSAYTITATDADNSGPLVYSISGADAALFSVDANTGVVTFITAPNFEAPSDADSDGVYDITVSVTDGDLNDSENVSITVTNVNEAPTITSASAFNAAQNQTSAFTAAATDPESDTITYSLTGTDAALFNIDANTGEVTFITAPTVAAPADANGDNVYEVVVTASDGSLSDDQNVSVTVTGSSNSAPVFVSGTSSSVSENQTSAYATRWSNAEESDTITFSLSGTDASLFQVDSETGEVSFITTPNFEAPGDGNTDNVYQFTLTINDGFQSVDQNISVTVGDAADTGDVPDNDTTTISMVSGGTYVGNLDVAGEQDWVRIELVAGQRYEFNLTGTGADELDDPYIRLFDETGTLIAENDDISLGTILDSRLGFTAQTSGTYYISAGAFTSDTQPGTTGEYTLTVEHTDPLREWSNDEIASYLDQNGWNGAQWNVTSGDTLTVDITGLTAAGQTLARAALSAWTEVTGIIFSEVSSGGQIIFDDEEEGAFAGPSGITGGFFTGATVNVGTDWLDTYGTNLDGYSFQTYIHEVGHALGLGHAGPYDGSADYAVDAIYLNDSWSQTVMSYFSQNENTYLDGTFAFLLTPMVADVLAAQAMYGTPTSVRDGNTVYGYNTNAGSIYDATAWGSAVAYNIFDTGGTDTLDFSGSNANQELDLRAEEFSDVLGGRMNLSISRGTVIENAIGGGGNDVFIGNAANNLITGNGGSDSYYASGGSDVFDGGAGSDTIYLSGSAGDYSTTTNGSGNTVITDLRAGSPNGVVELIGVENIVYDTEIPDSVTYPQGQRPLDENELSISVQDPGCICCAAGACGAHDQFGHKFGTKEPVSEIIDLQRTVDAQSIDPVELYDMLDDTGGDTVNSTTVDVDGFGWAGLLPAQLPGLAGDNSGSFGDRNFEGVLSDGNLLQNLLVETASDKAAQVQDILTIGVADKAAQVQDTLAKPSATSLQDAGWTDLSNPVPTMTGEAIDTFSSVDEWA